MQDAKGFYSAFSVGMEQLEIENEVNGEYTVYTYDICCICV